MKKLLERWKNRVVILEGMIDTLTTLDVNLPELRREYEGMKHIQSLCIKELHEDNGYTKQVEFESGRK